MSRCDFCGKKARAGNLVSHSGIRTKRLFKPNIHRLWLMRGGKRVRMSLCTGCLSKVRKPALPAGREQKGQSSVAQTT